MEIKEEKLVKEEESVQGSTESSGLSDLDRKIIRQVEYYFSDYNLPKDTFLKEQVLVDDGWVTIEVMLKFHRLSQLTKDADVIMNALKKSNSGLMELSDSAQKIRRSTDKPIPEDSDERKQEMKLKTVYCKGFPREGATIDKLLDFFKEYPTV